VIARRAVALVIAGALLAPACRDRRPDDEPDRLTRTDRRIDDALTPAAEVPTREGLAAAIVIDVSGSMEDEVEGPDGREEEKIEIARRAARDLVEQFARYAEKHPEESVLLGIYEFSERSGEADCRPVIPLSKPDRERAEAALRTLRARGGTPIGSAMVTAKRELDGTGFTRRHLLVVTDGENTDGFAPERVAAAIARRPESERPSIYFVAFDIEAKRFNRVREAGTLVLGAANARELSETLDSLLTGNILIER
jgi:Mg-chelatase subunit ChlD